MINLADLHGAKPPQVEIESERAWHLQAIYLAAQGLSQTEIAERLGHDHSWVSQVLRQPWARERLVAEIRKAGNDGIEAILKGAAIDSTLKLITLRDTADSEQVQLAAADKLLDRYLGKPTQHIEQKSKVSFDSADVDKLDAKIRELEAEEQRLTGRSPQASQIIVPMVPATVDGENSNN